VEQRFKNKQTCTVENQVHKGQQESALGGFGDRKSNMAKQTYYEQDDGDAKYEFEAAL
jgi:hypothetical protein